ncbi:hypothetical protein B0H11DRAFT_2185808 [Mycena galericulata]|nr:hypothetical protein B0H11DRAFT_2185808 [Mycena galericulata]
MLYPEPKGERETSGISGGGHKSGASGRRLGVLLSAVLATPQLGRVSELSDYRAETRRRRNGNRRLRRQPRDPGRSRTGTGRGAERFGRCRKQPEESWWKRTGSVGAQHNVTDFVEAVHILDGTRVTGSGPEGGRGNRG